ncbi:hypothetical protein DDA98_11565 [Clostridium perfringens]|uniref:type II toxin-antitoxin system RnlB family antitoxin n=1 Tax=Clostridium perfringens TaxID=1502 RepID=UPI000D50D0C1|nr:type II toxin-antitoxin system RnlB family antitoxin [Clostridium perfringens]PVE15079.1 hypothetical protein DDA98_11565 [Clostridium perfringens]
MENFMIKRINNTSEYIILSTSYISPLDELFDLEQELKILNFKGEIIFDLLLCNGLNDNRFLKGFFDGDYIDISNLTILNNIDSNIKKISKEFYINNSDLVEYSVLPDAHKYIVKNGLA